MFKRLFHCSNDKSDVQPQKQAKTSKTSKTTGKDKKKTLSDTVKKQKHYTYLQKPCQTTDNQHQNPGRSIKGHKSTSF